jgi:hypothetical protein
MGEPVKTRTEKYEFSATELVFMDQKMTDVEHNAYRKLKNRIFRFSVFDTDYVLRLRVPNP